MKTDSQNRLLTYWKQLSSTALGRWLFSQLLGIFIPYTGTVSPRVIELKPGEVTLTIHDRRLVRNHLNSIHAIALANGGELASGLAMIAALPESARAIVTNLQIEYLKKARGKLTVYGKATPPNQLTEPTESVAEAEIVDESGDTVSKVLVTWKIAPSDGK